MRQSEQRVPGRGRTPASFGREADPEPEDFTIRGGEAFHLVLHVEVKPDEASLQALHAAIRETTRAAVLDGYAAAFTEMDEPPAGPVDGCTDLGSGVGADPADGPGPDGGGGA